MTKFKVGDRVRINKTYGQDVNSLPGCVGTVKDTPCGNGWYGVVLDAKGPHRFLIAACEMDPVKTKPTLADTIALNPLTRRILGHLEKRGSISPMEALASYGCFRLAAQIFKLRTAGFDVITENREDAEGHRYARYTLAVA